MAGPKSSGESPSASNDEGSSVGLFVSGGAASGTVVGLADRIAVGAVLGFGLGLFEGPMLDGTPT